MLLSLEAVSLHYGERVLLDAVDLSIDSGDRLGLLGRNGAGKTTLLRLLAGEVEPDAGKRRLQPGSRIARLEQTLPQSTPEETIYDVVADGLAQTGALLREYHHLAARGGAADMEALARIQEQLETSGGWLLHQRVETILDRLSLPAEQPVASLSGGWRRRVALARALVSEPDMLLLDEPTNHLDLGTIAWLEETLRGFNGAVVIITHDRRFLQNTANRIAELDRGRLLQWRGDYQGFLRLREQQLAAEERAEELFDKRLAQEEVWIRQGIKARRTRNEGRVRALEKMRSQRRERRAVEGVSRMRIDSAERSGRIVAELEDVTLSRGGRTLLKNFSTIVQRGDRVGIIGDNGAGKSSLVQLMLGQLEPDSGRVTTGSKLRVAYFDQMRSDLDFQATVLDNICGGQEYLDIGGRRRHGISYAGDFLFTPERARTPVRALSGGEQSRVVLARLFSRPANLLVLDEPTNDLDIETLELLEERLLEFDGTLLLVSHDRQFMDNVVTHLLALDGAGGAAEFAGGYSDWLAAGGAARDRPVLRSDSKRQRSDRAQAEDNGPRSDRRPRKLSYKQQRELEQLPAQIASLETRQAELEERMSAPDFFNGDHNRVEAATRDLAEVQQALERAMERWLELEEKAGA